MNSMQRRLSVLESPGDYATIGQMLEALDADTDMACNIDPRITAFRDGPDILLDGDFGNVDIVKCIRRKDEGDPP